MPPVAINFAAILVLVLPGFLSYRFAVWRRADPSQRSPLWQFSEILEHSIFVHLSAIGLIAAIDALLDWKFGLDTYARVLVQQGPVSFLDQHFAEAILWFTLYPLYAIAVSPIVGSFDLPQKISSSVIFLLKTPTQWIASRCRWFSWLPIPIVPYPQEPVWYYAFNTMTQGYTASIPHVLVTLKSGDVFYGEMATYPIALDTELERDFLIRNVVYYPEGNLANEQRLYEVDEIGAVLLNTSNVNSIVIYYEHFQQ